jgi:hypothetical protein
MAFISSLGESAKKSFFRFPIVTLWAVTGSVFLIVIFGSEDDKLIESFQSLIIVLTLGVSWLIGCQFLSETLKHNIINRYVFKALVVTGLAIFYFYLNGLGEDLPEQAYERWGLLMLAGHLFVIFSPFVFLWDKSLFWNYLRSVIIALIRSSIYAIILYIGLALAVSALEFLFDVDFNNNIYIQIFVFCLGIVNTFVYLHDFPIVSELNKSIDFNKAIEVLIIYILIPLSLLYIIIVYAYALKILIDWELPRGWVTYLISGLSLLAFVIHMAIEPIRHKHDSKLIQKFFPYYFYAILPLLPLLFIGLYRRISDYNFTELRYLGLVLAIWITGMLIYMLISNKKPLSIYAKTMFLLVLLCTFGPLSAYKISMQAQLNELDGIMENLKSKTESSFTAEEYQRFSSVVRYIGYRQNLEKTEAFFGFNPSEVFSETSTYGIPLKIAEKLKIDITAAQPKYKNAGLFYNLNAFENGFAEEITDYTNFTILNLEKTLDDGKALQLHYDSKNIISFRYYGEELMETDMTSQLIAMAEKYDNLSNASPDEFTFRFKNDKGDFLFIFEKLNYRYNNGNIEITNGKALVFYKTFSALELP